jgi:hypothetical protein
MRLIRVPFYAVAVVAAILMYGASPSAESDACPTCGHQRWLVKVLAPPLDGQVVDVDRPPTQTVAGLNLLTKPMHPPKDAFVPPNEGHAVDVTACMYYVKEQTGSKGDLDYHLALADLRDPSKTLVAEIPNPTCTGACTSKFKAQYAAARAVLESISPVKALLQQIMTLSTPLDAKADPQRFVAAGILPKPFVVEVRGFQFFDNSDHGIGGNAKGVEIHPVYKFRAAKTSCNAPPKAVIQQQLQRYLQELRAQGTED